MRASAGESRSRSGKRSGKPGGRQFGAAVWRGSASSTDRRDIHADIVEQAQSGDRDAAGVAVEMISGLILREVDWWLRRSTRGGRYSQDVRDDLVSEVKLELVASLSKYDSRKSAWTTWASWRIKSVCSRWSKEQQPSGVRAPAKVHSDRIRLKRARMHLSAMDPGASVSDEEVVAEAGLSRGAAARAADAERCSGEPVSLSQSSFRLDTEAQSSTDPVDALLRRQRDEEFGPEDDAAEVLIRFAEAEAVCAAVAQLPTREREVLEARFGLSGRREESLAEIGSRLGVCRERVRQIERRALELVAVAMIQ